MTCVAVTILSRAKDIAICPKNIAICPKRLHFAGFTWSDALWAFFIMVSVLWCLLIFREAVPTSTWLGLAFIVVGGLVIHFGPNFAR